MRALFLKFAETSLEQAEVFVYSKNIEGAHRSLFLLVLVFLPINFLSIDAISKLNRLVWILIKYNMQKVSFYSFNQMKKALLCNLSKSDDLAIILLRKLVAHDRWSARNLSRIFASSLRLFFGTKLFQIHDSCLEIFYLCICKSSDSQGKFLFRLIFLSQVQHFVI